MFLHRRRFGTNKKKLTVVIPTYNRKVPLKEQLESLQKQGHYDEYDIIISDNHSNYDVEEMINQSFPSSFTNIISIYRRPCNVGGDMNVSLSFQLPTSEWVWLLSDDDISEINSIEIILQDIKNHENDDVCWIKYSISSPFKPNIEARFDNLVDVFNYYAEVKKATGEMVFVSNNLYRMTYLEKYLTDVCVFSDTCMSQTLLPLYAIKNDRKEVIFSSKAITNFMPGRSGWSPIWAYLRFGSFLSITTLSLTKQEIVSFKSLPFWNSRQLINSLAAVSSLSQRNVYFRKILSTNYSVFTFQYIKIKLMYIIMCLIGGNRWLKLVHYLHERRTKKTEA